MWLETTQSDPAQQQVPEICDEYPFNHPEVDNYRFDIHTHYIAIVAILFGQPASSAPTFGLETKVMAFGLCCGFTHQEVKSTNP